MSTYNDENDDGSPRAERALRRDVTPRNMNDSTNEVSQNNNDNEEDVIPRRVSRRRNDTKTRNDINDETGSRTTIVQEQIERKVDTNNEARNNNVANKRPQQRSRDNNTRQKQRQADNDAAESVVRNSNKSYGQSKQRQNDKDSNIVRSETISRSDSFNVSDLRNIHNVVDSLESEICDNKNNASVCQLLLSRIDAITSVISGKYHCVTCSSIVTIDRATCRKCSN